MNGNDEPRRLRLYVSGDVCPWEMFVPEHRRPNEPVAWAWEPCEMPRGHTGPHLVARVVMEQLGLRKCAGCSEVVPLEAKHVCPLSSTTRAT